MNQVPKPTIIIKGNHFTAGQMTPGHTEIITVSKMGEITGHCKCGFTKRYPSNYELSDVDHNPNTARYGGMLERTWATNKDVRNLRRSN